MELVVTLATTKYQQGLVNTSLNKLTTKIKVYLLSYLRIISAFVVGASTLYFLKALGTPCTPCVLIFVGWLI